MRGVLKPALLLALLLWLAAPLPALARLASLIADRVQVVGNSTIVATGNVIVVYEGVTLRATRIVFDNVSGKLSIEGPISIDDGAGSLILASEAELSRDLRDGILTSARLVLNQQLQIAAAEINRVQGRYTQASKVVASSCQVCAANPVPLWSIRAARVIHDQQARQLYFHEAQFRIADVPVLYLPRLRLPDPTLKRATGFLSPTLRSNSTIGVGLRVPYFITLGDHADVTLAPFVSNVTKTLEWRYRQAFASGNLQFDGAISQDRILPGTTRYFLLGTGHFDLPLGFSFDAQIEQVSDAGYLSDYGYSDKDRLRNHFVLSRVKRDEYALAEVSRWETLRGAEIPIADQLPFAQADLRYERRFSPALIGGEALVSFDAHGHFRTSNADIAGRDMVRVGGGLDWGRDWVFGPGLVARAELGARADTFLVYEDSRYSPSDTRLAYAGGVSLSWPLARQTASGAREVFEPVIQLAFGGDNGVATPNEDSEFVEWDEGNLFDLTRFPGRDRFETGTRLTIGASWTHLAERGLSYALAGGLVYRLGANPGFSPASGLAGTTSHLLLAGQADLSGRLHAETRLLLDNNFGLTKSESLLAYTGDKLSLTAGHFWLIADTTDNQATSAVREYTLDTSYRISDSWSASFNTHFDAVASKATKATLGVAYRNECVELDLSLSRRFTSSGSVTPTTDFAFGVTLIGFGSGQAGPARTCRR